jgi:hypothetical protein
LTLSHINDETPDQTLGERIDEVHSVQQLLRFPKGSDTYARAQQDLEWRLPALTIHMVAEGITHARTKLATASLSDDGKLTVEKWEQAM